MNISGPVKICNKLLENAPEDYLYHFGIAKNEKNIEDTYGDVKFVCTGGSSTRITSYAEMFSDAMNFKMSENLNSTDRYVLYKTGPVLWANHGIGGPSLSIALVELIKLLHYAKATDVVFFRIGTCGGLGMPAGTVVISNGCLNGELEEGHIQYIMGQKVLRPAAIDKKLSEELYSLGSLLELPVAIGKTLAADDFYEGQARVDGAFCEYTYKDKIDFLRRLYELGVRNIEMESTCFVAMLARANIRSAIVCVTVVDRMQTDSIKMTDEQHNEFQKRPFKLISAFMERHLK